MSERDVSVETWTELIGHPPPERDENPLFDKGPRRVTIAELWTEFDRWRADSQRLTPTGNEMMWTAKLNALRSVTRAGLVVNDIHEAFLHGDALDLLEEVTAELRRAVNLAQFDVAKNNLVAPGERAGDLYAARVAPFIEQATSLSHAYALAVSVGSDGRLDASTLRWSELEDARGERERIRNAWRRTGYLQRGRTLSPKRKLELLKQRVHEAVKGKYPSPNG